MNFLKRSFDFLLFGNIYVAIATACLIQSTIIQLSATNHLIAYSLLSFFATIFVYNLQRIFYKMPERKALVSIRRKWVYENQVAIKFLTVVGLCGVGVTFFYTDYRILFYLSPLLLLSVAYFLPAIKLRKNSWFKLLTLSLVWTTVTAVVPMRLVHHDLFSTECILHFFVRWTFMIAICIPFDIRDMEVDKAENITTFSQKLGEQKTRWIAFAFMVLYIICISAEYYLQMFPLKILIALLFTAIINAVIVLMSSSKRGEYFYTALLDGTMILQGFVLVGVYYL